MGNAEIFCRFHWAGGGFCHSDRRAGSPCQGAAPEAGEAAVLCDGQGTDYQAEVTELGTGSITLRILSRGPSESEPKVDCTVYMGFAKGDKLEHVIQKATELGANRICAFPSSRCVAKFDRKSLEKKLPRWQKIAASAAEQSGRGRIPTVFAADSYAHALELAAQADRRCSSMKTSSPIP